MGAIDQYASYMLEHFSPRENAKTTRVAARSATATVQKESKSSGTNSNVTHATAKAARYPPANQANEARRLQRGAVT